MFLVVGNGGFSEEQEEDGSFISHKAPQFSLFHFILAFYWPIELVEQIGLLRQIGDADTNGLLIGRVAEGVEFILHNGDLRTGKVIHSHFVKGVAYLDRSRLKVRLDFIEQNLILRGTLEQYRSVFQIRTGINLSSGINQVVEGGV